MHLADGILPMPILAAGYAAAGTIAFAATRRLKPDDIPRIALVGSGFFVASMIRVPTGVGSVHLLLQGLAGVLLGPRAFLAIGMGLVFQALLLGHGGVTTLGVNACLIGIPAVGVGWVDSRLKSRGDDRFRSLAAGGLAAVATAVSVVCASLVLLSGGDSFVEASAFLFATHAPVIVIEPVITTVVISFLQKVKPGLLQ